MAHTETSPRGLGDSPSRRTAHESLRVFVRIRPSHKPSARKAERDVLQADEQTVSPCSPGGHPGPILQ